MGLSDVFVSLGLTIGLIILIVAWISWRSGKQRSQSKGMGGRYGNGKHTWEVSVNDIKHTVTLKSGLKDTLLLDGYVLKQGVVWSNEEYEFKIDKEPSLLISKGSVVHRVVYKLYVSGNQVP